MADSVFWCTFSNKSCWKLHVLTHMYTKNYLMKDHWSLKGIFSISKGFLIFKKRRITVICYKGWAFVYIQDFKLETNLKVAWIYDTRWTEASVYYINENPRYQSCQQLIHLYTLNRQFKNLLSRSTPYTSIQHVSAIVSWWEKRGLNYSYRSENWT